MRFCVALGVTPVFAPPLETGFQAVIENFNGFWQQKVWARFHHENLTALRRHLAQRRDHELPRRPFPKDWNIDWQSSPRGTLVYLRRTNERGSVTILGHRWQVDPLWSHRLLRCQVDLTHHRIDFYRLRRREPPNSP
jgi:hypothetical protein